LYQITAQLSVPLPRLNAIVISLIKEMHTGLGYGEYSSLLMLPSFIFRDDTRPRDGKYMALNLGGGSNDTIRFKVL